MRAPVVVSSSGRIGATSALHCLLLLVATFAVTPSAAQGQNLAVLVKDIAPGTDSTTPSFFADLNGTLIFGMAGSRSSAEDGLWRSDGTPAGTTVIVPGMSFSAYDTAVVNGAVLVQGSAAGGPHVLWRTDGTPAGTFPLTNFSLSGRPMARVGN